MNRQGSIAGHMSPANQVPRSTKTGKAPTQMHHDEHASDEDDSGSFSSEEAITKEEIEGTAAGPSSSEAPKPRNAFAELMAPKPKAQPKPPPTTAQKSKSFTGRYGLGIYVANPEAYPERYVFHNKDNVAIRDVYPKASVHCLLLPRSPAHNLLTPFDAFDDPAFLASVRADAAKLKTVVAKELQRLFGKYSAKETKRQAVLNGDAEPDVPGELPTGRDWEKEVIVGIHARPSMSHLHVHVISRDLHSACVKHKKHYLSFHTTFFVPLEDFPLTEDDPRRHLSGWHIWPMVCYRCGKDFGNRFKQLKEHLEKEFEAWKKE